MKRCEINFDDIVLLENLCEAWQEFIRGKRKKKDVQEFAFHLSDEIVSLHEELVSGTYRHGSYHEFRINDPKPRVIHKASVRDRLLHHALHRKLYPYFASRFIADSFSCQKDKGTHRALDRFRQKIMSVSHNHTKTCWVLKCDIRKFFASVDQCVLVELLEECITDQRLVLLLCEIIGSFSTKPGKGIPLGNLTSQLFANIYMNPFDYYVKQELCFNHYIRYADDFVFLSINRKELEVVLKRSYLFLSEVLALDMHPDKVLMKTIASGMDYLGWKHFPHHRVLRIKTKKRMMKRMVQNPTEATFQSHLGMLGHGDSYKLQTGLRNDYWFRGHE